MIHSMWAVATMALGAITILFGFAAKELVCSPDKTKRDGLAANVLVVATVVLGIVCIVLVFILAAMAKV